MVGKKAGDDPLYKKKARSLCPNTYGGDMFIHKNNIFNLNSINVRYNFPKVDKEVGNEMSIYFYRFDRYFLFSINSSRNGTSYPYQLIRIYQYLVPSNSNS